MYLFQLQECDSLAYDVGILVQKMAGGVGPALAHPNNSVKAHF